MSQEEWNTANILGSHEPAEQHSLLHCGLKGERGQSTSTSFSYSRGTPVMVAVMNKCHFQMSVFWLWEYNENLPYFRNFSKWPRSKSGSGPSGVSVLHSLHVSASCDVWEYLRNSGSNGSSFLGPTMKMCCQDPGTLEPTFPPPAPKSQLSIFPCAEVFFLTGTSLISSWVFDCERCWLCYISIFINWRYITAEIFCSHMQNFCFRVNQKINTKGKQRNHLQFSIMK